MRWDAERLLAADREARPRTRRSTRSRPGERRRFRGADAANAGGNVRREAPRRAVEPRPCGQATKRWAPKGGAEERPEEIGKRERWSPSGQRRKEEIQRRESVKCGLAFPGNGRELQRRKQMREDR